MRFISVAVGITISCLSASIPVMAQSAAGPSIRDLDVFIGEWEGRSTFLFPRDEGRAPAHEDVTAVCKYVLKETYIQCDTAWTRSDGRTRTFRIHFNYNEEEGGYQTLFIYDNWPGISKYVLRYDSDAGDYVGFTEYENNDGVIVDERIVWVVSQDGNEIRSEEYHHAPSDSEGVWVQSFEFVWRRRN